MNTEERSNRLLHITLSLLRRERRLLVFHFVSAALFFVIWGFFLVPLLLEPTGYSLLSDAHWGAVLERFAALSGNGSSAEGANWPSRLEGVATYVIAMLVETFFQVAFYHEAKRALAGESVSVERGLRFAISRWRAIASWSLFAGVVGWLISEIESRVSWVGKLIMAGIGLAWSTASVFVIPVMVCEAKENNPLKLVRSSSRALRQTWGELIVGLVPVSITLGLVLSVFTLIGCIAGLSGMIYLCTVYHLPYWIFALIGGLGFFVLMQPLFVLQSVVVGVYRCAMFIYATEGVIPDAFDQELLDSGWQVK